VAPTCRRELAGEGEQIDSPAASQAVLNDTVRTLDDERCRLDTYDVDHRVDDALEVALDDPEPLTLRERYLCNGQAPFSMEGQLPKDLSGEA
jgi:hypothetical protein